MTMQEDEILREYRASVRFAYAVVGAGMATLMWLFYEMWRG